MNAWKTKFLALLSFVMLGAAMTVSVSAATAGYTTDVDGTVNYDDNRKCYTATFDNVIQGKEYSILMVEGSTGNWNVSSDSIRYINQKTATSSTISFDMYPDRVANSVVLLGGIFSSGSSPKVLGTVIKPYVAPELEVVVNSKGVPELSWNAVDGATKYQIARYDSIGKKYVVIKNLSDTTFTFTDTTVESGVTYYYRVRGYSDGVYGTYSNTTKTAIK